MSAWARAIVVPLAIVQSLNTGRPLPDGFTIDELFVPGVSKAFPCPDNLFSWKSFFMGVDKVCKLWERFGSRSIRAKAIEKCKEWVLERTRYTDGLAAIYPPMMYTIMALDLLGCAPGDPDRDEAEQQFFNLMVDDVRAALAQVREGGAVVDEKIEDHDYGSFGWFTDPDGNRVELWQPMDK